jgi:hypothetical protein
MPLTKQEVIDRLAELDELAQNAATMAKRHEIAKQGSERLKLRKECELSGGHLTHGWNPGICQVCGADLNAAKKTLARNLTGPFTASYI